jgi:hypothetical protein
MRWADKHADLQVAVVLCKMPSPAQSAASWQWHSMTASVAAKCALPAREVPVLLRQGSLSVR